MEFRTKREAEPFEWKRERLQGLAAERGASLMRRAILSDAWHHWFEAARIRDLRPTLPD